MAAGVCALHMVRPGALGCHAAAAYASQAPVMRTAHLLLSGTEEWGNNAVLRALGEEGHSA